MTLTIIRLILPAISQGQLVIPWGVKTPQLPAHFRRKADISIFSWRYDIAIPILYRYIIAQPCYQQTRIIDQWPRLYWYSLWSRPQLRDQNDHPIQGRVPFLRRGMARRGAYQNTGGAEQSGNWGQRGPRCCRPRPRSNWHCWRRRCWSQVAPKQQTNKHLVKLLKYSPPQSAS